MRAHPTVFVLLLLMFGLTGRAGADVLVRWDQDQIPSPQSLGISTVVMPATNRAGIRHALSQGYRLFLEVDVSALTGFRPPLVAGFAGIIVTGGVSAKQLLQLEQQFKSPGVRIATLEERGKWPHIRTNLVTKNNDVLVVTNRSAQPWIENNAALVRIARGSGAERPVVLSYPWKPITLADVDEGPALENYLVAIAEAGSLGSDLLLPLHPRFQQRLILAEPQTRLHWTEIRRYLEFFSWSLPGGYRPIANVGVVVAEPAQSFEVMNLLLRHNLPFELIAPGALPKRNPESFDLLIVLDRLKGPEEKIVSEFAAAGGTLVIAEPQGAIPWRLEAPTMKTEHRASYRFGKGRVVEVLSAIANPDAFALEVRQLLGPEHRVIDIWNGITVLAAPYQSPDGTSVLVTAINYAHQPLPVQLRVRGTFSVVHYESPEEQLTLLPHEHHDGHTEFVLPALRVGGRVFLSERTGSAPLE